MKLLVEKMQINNIIVNPEDNIEVAHSLAPIINTFKRTVRMKRDNCGDINYELYYHLIDNGINQNDINVIRAEFKTDNLNLLDKMDLTPKERSLYRTIYSSTFTNSMIIEFIKDGNTGLPLEDFYYLPHQWLEYKGLILDAASDMFNKGMESKITKNNYIKER